MAAFRTTMTRRQSLLRNPILGLALKSFMPYPKKYRDEEDPEKIAERELEQMKEALDKSDDRPSEKDAVPTSPQEAVKQAAKHVKESKASRKKRNRGVSGSSIKKDGGRFDYGLDFDNDYDEPTEEVDEDECKNYDRCTRDSYSSHSVGVGSDSEQSSDSSNIKNKESKQVVGVHNCMAVALSCDDEAIADLTVADLLVEVYDDTARVRLVHEAIISVLKVIFHNNILQLTRSFATLLKEVELLVTDPFFEYRMVLMVSRLIHQGLLRAACVFTYAINVLEDDHSLRLLNVSNRVAENLMTKDEMVVSIATLAKYLLVDFDIATITRSLRKLDIIFFHSNFVHEVCMLTINSMVVNVFVNSMRSISDLVNDDTLTKLSVNVGFLRFFKNIADLEKKLPGASSLANLLMSYAVNDFHLIDDTTSKSCPRPLRYIKADHKGIITVMEKKSKNCDESNYFTMES
ncbi:hypothetical protein DICVIV_04060 [Dictyocaulus viviparus]|uniref:Uncharacterized protein n=1 Tax=Dictyocaulus viviparus TaxID=29172 RepID=A0A0D8Y0Y8_DICVI|nr:hypothetical protein DICVIV_04060 [Dictyocaulus viviparus]